MAGLRRFMNLIRLRQDERDVQDELRLHVDMESADLERRGLSADEARRRALVEFGGLERVRAEARGVRRAAAVEAWGRDVRLGSRALARTPLFSVTVLVVLAIAIGATTAGFVLVHRIVLQPLPFPDSQRFVAVSHAAPGLGSNDVGLSSGLHAYYREQARSFESIATYSHSEAGIRGTDGTTDRVRMTFAGVALFEMFGVKPAVGRLFTKEDGRPGFMNMTWPIPVLLAHDFWVRRFGADPAVVGRTLTINDRQRLIVGVLPDDFRFPAPDTQIWVLLERQGPNFVEMSGSFARSLGDSAVAKLRPGVTAHMAERELHALLPGIVGRYPDATAERFAEVRLAPRVTPLKEHVAGVVAPILWTVFGAMICLFGIAAANAGSLFAIRAQQRQREVMLRRALGAQATQIVRLFFVEALVLLAAAAVVGLILARVLVRIAVANAPMELPRVNELTFGAPAMAFAAGLALSMAMAYGWLSTTRQRGESMQIARTGAGPRPGRHRLREPLIALQVTLALTLMVGSLLMVQTYRNLTKSELGFRPGRLLVMEVGLASRRYTETRRIYADVIARLAQVPGVARAGAASFVPLAASLYAFPVNTPGIPVPFRFFMPGYFQTIDTRVLEGEGFADASPAAWPNPVLVSAALAQRLYPGGPAIGKPLVRFEEDGSPVMMGAGGVVPPFTITGIVANTAETSLRGESTEVVYVPVLDPPVERSVSPVNMSVIVRTQVPPTSLARVLREAVAAVDPSLTVGRTRTMDSIVQSSRGTETFMGALLLAAALISLLLGIVGIYGSVAHGIAGRTREIAVRLALGATRGGIVRMAVTRSMWTVAAGMAAGLVLALVATRALRTFLFGVEPADPTVLAVSTAVLAISSAAAGLLAARRAARISPGSVLRGD